MDDSDADSGFDQDSDYDDMEEDEDFDVEPPAPTEEPGNFRVMDSAKLKEMQASDVRRVAETLCSPPSEVAVLLRAFKWDSERVISAYFENPEGVLEKAGVCDLSKLPTIDGVAAEAFKCPICLDQVTTYCSLGCGHRACTDCYRAYVTHKIDDEGPGSIHARCPSVKCGVRLTESLVADLVAPELHTKFAMYLEQSYVEDNPRFEWCPAPTCTNAIYMRGPPESMPLCGALRVQCACSEAFCFRCRRDDHSPATCDQLRQWLVKCKDDSETYNWLQANTRSCPTCKTAIEKNGGCNHMTCKKCAYEWCWVCGGAWKDHSGNFYTCNKYKESDDSEDVKRKDQSKVALERYLHYYTRYINHHNSLKLEEGTRKKMEDKILEMQSLGNNTWLDVQYLKEAAEALLACRHALQYTYVYAFYLSPSNHKELFEMAQRDLEMTTEDLSAETTEKPVEEIDRHTVLHHQHMSKKRLENLFSAVEAHRAAEREALLSGSQQSQGE